MFAGVASALQSLLAQPPLLAMGAGLLAGAITGTTLVVTGIFPHGTAGKLTIVSCYDGGRPIGEVPAGESLLVTARSADGTWLEVYIGVPGADRGWAPASALRFTGSTSALPVGTCVGSIPLPSLGPPATASPTPVTSGAASVPPTEIPSAAPTIVATVGPTLSPGVSPSPSPKPTKTPKPSSAPTPLPPPPTIPPTPAPTADVFPPTVSAPYITSPGAFSNGSYYIGHLPCSPPTATVRANVSDPSGLAYVRLWYARPQGGGSAYLTMSQISTGVYEAVIAPDNTWLDGEVGLWAIAQDSHGNTSAFIPFGNPNSTSDVSLFWSAFCVP